MLGPLSTLGLTNVLLFVATRHSLLRKVVGIQPHIRITTHQVTVLEDARGIQAIHLHTLTTPNRPEDFDINSEKGGMSEGGMDEDSIIAKRRPSDSEFGTIPPILLEERASAR